MKKIINFCGNCPFRYSDYDDFAVGDSTAEVCTLAMYKKFEDYFILFHNGDIDNDDGDGMKTPEWCPLKTEEHTFEFKEFSPERKEKIEIVKKELTELMNFIDNSDDYFDKNYIEKNERISELNSILADLVNNEEFFGDDFNNEINDKVLEIKRQLELLEEATLKMNNTFNNFGK